MIINLTPHSINYIRNDGTVVTLESAGIARAKQTNVPAGDIDGFAVVKTTFGDVVDLPDFNAGTYYVVSAITAAAAKAHGRTTADLLLTADAVRNDAGQIIGCKAFALYE